MSGAWQTVIGLEVHCQLGTASKLFCSCANTFGAAPNSLICPVCAGLPGALPVLNEQALDLALRAAVALGAHVPERSWFARKHYFYPDLPKGYQITQYEAPLALGGQVELDTHLRARLTRIHMEEDAGKLLHTAGGATRMDLNRAGAPLIEIVGEPDLTSAAHAAQYLERLREILQFAGVSACDMEKGELRCDVNVSVRQEGAPLGTKVEIKNLNSFKHVRAAIEFDTQRQIDLLARRENVRQETRQFDPERGQTRPMRDKENAHDYRYFPEPDLLPLDVGAAQLERATRAVPELPAPRRLRYEKALGLSPKDARTLTASRVVADYFEAVLRQGTPPRDAANWIANDVAGLLLERRLDLDSLGLTPYDLAELIGMVSGGKLSSTAARTVLRAMAGSPRGPREWARELGLEQTNDAAQLAAWCDAALAAAPAAVAAVRGGESKALGPLIAAVLKLSAGRASPAAVKDLLLEKIHAGA